MPPFQLPLRGHVESPTLDFKKRSPINTEEHRIELAKDVAALANALGGVLISGAWEVEGALSRYLPYDNEEAAEEVRRAYEKAVLDRCVPAPIVTCEKRLVAPPVGEVEGLIVLVHVTAYPGQPVGVRVGAGEKATYFFPVRVGADTKYYRPDQLAMLMSAKVRRMAILLNAIPRDAPCSMHQFTKDGGKHPLDGLVLDSVDEATNSVRFKVQTGSVRTVPLDHVQTVYFDQARQVWKVAVRRFE